VRSQHLPGFFCRFGLVERGGLGAGRLTADFLARGLPVAVLVLPAGFTLAIEYNVDIYYIIF